MELIKCFSSPTLNNLTLGYGPLVQKFEQEFGKYSNKQFKIGTNSGSAAAWMIFAWLKHLYGKCNIFIPSLSFISPAWAAKELGHEVILVDVNKNLTIDINDYWSKRKRVINRPSILFLLLYGGISKIDIQFDDEIIVVDAAHSVNLRQKCDFAFYSFYPTKPICMSQGGIICTNDEEANNYFLKYRNFGRENRGDTYQVVEDGFKFYMDNLNAQIGLQSISTVEERIIKRKKNFNYLTSKIKNSFIKYILPHDIYSSFYLCTLILQNYISSQWLRGHLRANNVESSFHYPFLHKSVHFNFQSELKFLDLLDDHIINIPIYENLNTNQLDVICKIINSC